MIHILLTTLKVIGILLAATILLLLALILIVLFVPIRYKVKVNNMDVRAKVTWLCPLISVKVLFIDKEFKYKVRLFGIPLNFNKKIKEKPKENLSAKTDKRTEKPKNNEKTEKSVIENTNEKTEQNAEEKVEVEKEKQTLLQKLKEILEKIKSKIIGIYDKIVGIKDKISIYKKFLTTDEAKENIRTIKCLVFDLVRYVLPTKLKGIIKFGFDNPETTGKALAVASMFYYVYGDNITLEPDFDNKLFEADIKFKGRIRLYRFLVAGFKLWRNKWIKKLIRFAKTH